MSKLSTQYELYISFTDYSTGFGGTYGVQTDRVDKVIKHVQHVNLMGLHFFCITFRVKFYKRIYTGKQFKNTVLRTAKYAFFTDCSIE